MRRLDGIAYWIIGDPEAIYDFINSRGRKEWIADAKFEGRELQEKSYTHDKQPSLVCTGDSFYTLHPM